MGVRAKFGMCFGIGWLLLVACGPAAVEEGSPYLPLELLFSGPKADQAEAVGAACQQTEATDADAARFTASFHDGIRQAPAFAAGLNAGLRAIPASDTCFFMDLSAMETDLRWAAQHQDDDLEEKVNNLMADFVSELVQWIAYIRQGRQAGVVVDLAGSFFSDPITMAGVEFSVEIDDPIVARIDYPDKPDGDIRIRDIEGVRTNVGEAVCVLTEVRASVNYKEDMFSFSDGTWELKLSPRFEGPLRCKVIGAVSGRTYTWQ